MKSARRRAREMAIQGLYSWQMSGLPAAEILAHLSDSRDFERADRAMLQRLLSGAIDAAESLRETLSPLLDRPWPELSPVERAVLLLAAFELSAVPEVPYRVVINEAVELAKIFGGTDGHKYVNGVLDRVSRALRPAETA
ncbi:MAG: transcription antitermination factor NusB [Betaproteobacteria bacterium]|nr:transcription antitermination factor NusB [Betaproteobacteria bacterium]